MLITRNGKSPQVHPSAHIAETAQIIGDVRIGERCYIDYGAVIESSGTPIEIEKEVLVLANAVIRSVGGVSRPAFGVHIGERTLISPLCALVGCQLERECYIATGAMIFQGAQIGEGSRVSAGAIVHLNTVLPPMTRVGLRHFAVPDGAGFLITPDVETARARIGAARFFKTVFEVDEEAKEKLHGDVMAKLLAEMLGWQDEPVRTG